MPPNSEAASVVLGIDPGLATTGWGVLEKNGSRTTLLGFGAIVCSASLPLPARLLQIRQALTGLIRKYSPSVVALEELFFTKFARSIASTAQARGVILLTVAEHHLPLVEYNPRAIKLAATGFGSASKLQIQSMIQRHFSLKTLPTPDDAADALAIALCHVQTHPSLIDSRKMVPGLEKALASVGVKL